MSISQITRPAAPSLLHEAWVRRWSVAAITMIATASSLYYSWRQPPIYVAESRVLVSTFSLEGTGEEVIDGPNMDTEQEIAASAEVARVVRDRLRLAAPARDLIDDLSIETPQGTEILVFTFAHPDPATARAGAQAFAEEYVQLRRRGAVQEQIEAAAKIQTQIDALAEQLQRLDDRIGRVSSDAILESLVDRATLLTSLLVQQRQQLVAFQAPPEVGRLFQPGLALGRLGPGYARNVVIGLMLGLAVGFAQAGLRGRLDDRLRSVEEAEPYLRTPTLALIPALPKLDEERSTLFAGVPTSISEAFVPLRLAFLAAASRREATAFAVTSCAAGEGKSTITAHLAISLARAGRRVSVICADPRNHRLEQLLSSSADIGLVQVLDGSVPLGQALVPTRIRNLSVLPCGRAATSHADLFQLEALRDCFVSVRERSAFVLLDIPPLGGADGLSLLPLVDTVLFVVDARRMHARRLAVARRQLDRLETDVLGVVFNRTGPSMIKPERAAQPVAISSA